MNTIAHAIRKASSDAALAGGRWGTVSATRSEIVSALGNPSWECNGGEKVTVSWAFFTPAGVAEVRDYWWNGPDEWSLCAVSEEAARMFVEFLSAAGLQVGDAA